MNSADRESPRVSTLDLSMMERALQLADRAASLGEVPVGAVVYRTSDATIVGEGFNRREIDKDPAAHAEFAAIMGACRTLGDWRLNDCSLAVTLEPCAMCAGLIVNARVGRVLYGAEDPKAGACRSLFAITTDARLNHRAELVSGVMAEESATKLRAFFRNLRAQGG